MHVSIIRTYLARATRRIPTDRGASLVEYALLVALIAIVCMVAIAFLGGSTETKLSDVGNSVSSAGS